MSYEIKLLVLTYRKCHEDGWTGSVANLWPEWILFSGCSVHYFCLSQKWTGWCGFVSYNSLPWSIPTLCHHSSGKEAEKIIKICKQQQIIWKYLHLVISRLGLPYNSKIPRKSNFMIELIRCLHRPEETGKSSQWIGFEVTPSWLLRDKHNGVSSLRFLMFQSTKTSSFENPLLLFHLDPRLLL